MNESHSPIDEHTVHMQGRHAATLTGVEDVDCFNEQIIILRTSQGMLTLTGEGLNIRYYLDYLEEKFSALYGLN